jgi:hypothetical protein
MRLINVQTGFQLAVINDADQTVEINEPHLKNSFAEKGITIPPVMQEIFEGKEVVKLGDRKFSIALKEVYWRFNLDSKIYKWFK